MTLVDVRMTVVEFRMTVEQAQDYLHRAIPHAILRRKMAQMNYNPTASDCRELGNELRRRRSCPPSGWVVAV